MTSDVSTESVPGAAAGAVVPSLAERVGLQLGHRLGSAGLLVLLGGVGAFFAHKPHGALLLLAFGCADVGFLGAFVALVLGRRAGRPSREALGTVLFCATVLLGTVAMLVASRLREPAP